jgi:hypothetical protein
MRAKSNLKENFRSNFQESGKGISLFHSMQALGQDVPGLFKGNNSTAVYPRRT